MHFFFSFELIFEFYFCYLFLNVRVFRVLYGLLGLVWFKNRPEPTRIVFRFYIGFYIKIENRPETDWTRTETDPKTSRFLIGS